MSGVAAEDVGLSCENALKGTHPPKDAGRVSSHPPPGTIKGVPLLPAQEGMVLMAG